MDTGKTRDVETKSVAYGRPAHAPRSRSLPGAPDPAPWIGGEETSLSSTQPAPPDTARRRRRGPLTGAQDTSKPLPMLLQAQPGTFQFARDLEAPPSGRDVTRVLGHRVRLPLSVVTRLPLIWVLRPSSRYGDSPPMAKASLNIVKLDPVGNAYPWGWERGGGGRKRRPGSCVLVLAGAAGSCSSRLSTPSKPRTSDLKNVQLEVKIVVLNLEKKNSAGISR